MKPRWSVALPYVLTVLVLQAATAASTSAAPEQEPWRVIWLAVLLMLSLVCLVLVALLWRERRQERQAGER